MSALEPTEVDRPHSPVSEGAGHESDIERAYRRPVFDRRTAVRPTLSLVIPTYNEVENLPILIGRLADILSMIDYELIVVDDDSPDRSWELAEAMSVENKRIRSIRRIGERGLSSAVMAGVASADGDVVAVIDADLQHDPSILPEMITPILAGRADVVVASREVDGGSYGDFAASRRTLSVAGASLARALTGTPVSDPMSGFFALSREHMERVAPKVNPRGFKILLEFLARGEQPRVAEIGYEFGQRQHGETKLTTSVAFSYLVSLIGLVTGRMLSATMTAYLLVGLFGVLVQFAVLGAAASLGLAQAALIGFEASVLSNYVMNNRFTFTHERRRGRRFLAGLLPFHIVAAHGMVVQIGLVALATGEGPGVGSGPIGYRLLGIALATAGNFALNRNLTWRPRTGIVTL
ncbi:MAG: glycosyltransferase family 2 protein [Actinomycetota bacterium]|nr:glycosyltransferase family 2 protein [Actinomycetota bacterium]